MQKSCIHARSHSVGEILQQPPDPGDKENDVTSRNNEKSFFKDRLRRSLRSKSALSFVLPGGNSIDKQQEPEIASRRPQVGRKYLPPVTGPYTVGCVDLMTCDDHLDLQELADHLANHRDEGAFFRLFYPTNKTDVFERYMQWPLWLPHKKYAYGYVHFLKRNKRIFYRLFNWLGGDIYVPVLWQAPLLKEGGPFPVVILSHGFGGNRTTYTTLCCELASRGYIVASLEHRDGSASMTMTIKQSHRSSIRICNDHNHLTTTNNSSGNSSSNNNNNLEEQNHNLFHQESTTTTTTTTACDDGRCVSGKGLKDEENRLKAKRRQQRLLRQRRHHPHVRHRNVCSEEWRPFRHIDIWDDFDTRNSQMYHRADECCQVLDELDKMNQGEPLHNALDINFNTSQFKGRLDLNRVSVVGHSFGVATCLAALNTDPRFRVGIALDGWMHPVDDDIYNNTEQPVLFLNMEQFQWEQNVNRMLRFINTSKADTPMLTVRGACHQSVSDFQFLVPSLMGKYFDVVHQLQPHLCMSTTVSATIAFLNKHLDIPLTEEQEKILEGNHPHVMCGTNVDLTIPNTGPTPP